VRCALREFEILCSLWAGTPGNRSILLPRRGELLGNTSEVAMTASSSVTLSESFKIDVSWFAAKKKVTLYSLKLYNVVFFILTDPNMELNPFLVANHIGCQTLNLTSP
jgi:hypothetical protein